MYAMTTHAADMACAMMLIELGCVSHLEVRAFKFSPPATSPEVV